MNSQKLQNKKIIISGAADGIGWSIAQACMNNGAIVYISDNNNVALDKISQDKFFEKQFFIDKVNTNNINEVEDYFSKLKNNIDNIDSLINNVGIAGPTGKIEDINVHDWKETIDVNINSHFYYIKHSIPLIKKNNGGSILNLSSTAGQFGFPLRSPYAASKWAIIGLTKTLAMELGEFNIRVNAICPGSVSGNRMKKVIEAKAKSLDISEDSLKKDYASMVSLRSFIDKEDIANIAVFLLSDEANKISGQAITVDGNTERMN